jgi:uncharacterized cupredoxin-like copper-binding protein
MKAMMVVAIGVGAIAVQTASAGASGQPAQPLTPAKATLLARVNVKASDTSCLVSPKTARRGVVVFKVKNVGKVGHAFQIKSRKTRVISPGKSATLRITLLRKGHYQYQCTTNGHATAGMKGLFTIT